MPDLSNLLGAVYGDGPTSTGTDPEDEAHVEKEPAAAERDPAVPDWADDDHLDAAFAQWKPGPSADASAVERAFVNDADDDHPPPLADDLAAALSEALVAAADPDDSAETAHGPQAAPRFDFSMQDDEDDDPSEEAEPPQAFAPLQPVETPTPQPLEETVEETVEPVVDQEPEPAPEPEPESVELKHVDEPEEMPRPSITTQREAAAELTAASRLEPTPVAAEADPAPEPMPVASVPVAPIPEPMLPAMVAGEGSPTKLPPGTRRWEHGDDDILPEKQAKKFFSFSLRRG
jgi:hypothetical protein